MRKIIMGLAIIAGVVVGSVAYADLGLPECIDCASCDRTGCTICEGDWCVECKPKCGAKFPRKEL